MKPKAGITLLVAAALASGPGANAAVADDASRIFPYEVRTETLDNGLRVVLVPFAAGGLVAYWTVVRTGSRDEYESGRTGFAHFFEHMMFRGTEKYPAEKLNQFYTETGSDPNAFTSDDLTAYSTLIAREDLERVMEVESDRFQNLSYSEDAFQTEAGAVYGEYRKNRTQPMFALIEAVRKAAFEVHTYGHMAMGFEDDIRHMPALYEYSKAFFSRYYRPENVILLLTGDLDVEPTLALVRRYYGDWRPGYEPPEVEPEPQQTAERRVQVAYEGRTLPLVWIAYKDVAFDPEDRGYVAEQLFGELAFGQTSDVYKKLVIAEQAVEFIGVAALPSRDPNLFSIVARVKDPAKIDEVIAEIDRTIAAASAAPPDETRLAELKSRMKYEFLMALDTPMSVASQMARFLAVGGDARVIDQYFSTIEKVTADDVLEAVRQRFVPERRTVGVLKGAE